jgi:hypothetical protein
MMSRKEGAGNIYLIATNNNTHVLLNEMMKRINMCFLQDHDVPFDLRSTFSRENKKDTT